MKTSYPILACAILLFLSGCASTDYKTFEGRNQVFEGDGGTRVTIEGIDFWENGEPPRKFVLMGIIDDERPGGIIPMARLKKDIAKKAKAQGADAVILLGSGSKIRGYVTNASATTTFSGNSAYSSGTGVSAPILRNSASFAVIKYVK
jgi:hypothetical protein